MDSRRIIKRLRDDGWVEAGRKGSHRKYKHPNAHRHVVVQHPSKDIPIGTLRNIHRQAGWSWPDSAQDAGGQEV